MKILLIHLSDLHIREASDRLLSQAELISSTTYSKIHSAEAVFIVVSGDIAYSGKKDEYNLALDFFTDLSASLSKETGSPIYFILTPGNHDCNFDGDQSVRETLVQTILSNKCFEVTDGIIKQCVMVQENFICFRETVSPSNKTFDDSLWVTYVFDINGYQVLFDCLNVAWMSDMQEKQGSLVFPIDRYMSLKNEAKDMRFIILHHPLNWYGQISYRPFRNHIRSLGQFIITGHEHANNIVEMSDAESGESISIEGGVLQPDDPGVNASFNIIEVDLADNKYRYDDMAFDGKVFSPRTNISWQDYRQLPKKPHSGLSITEVFSKITDDPGATFMHPGKQHILLSDIYVFPDLRQGGGHEIKLKDIINSSLLKDPKLLSNGILIKGEEKSGKTSLLYQLYRSYYDNGFTPLMIKGNDLRQSEKDLSKSLTNAVQKQYGKESINVFLQTPTDKKILLLDDFDALKFTNPQRSRIIDYLKKEFGGVVISVSGMFELDEAISDGGSSSLFEFKEYVIQEFGYKLRFDLIRKWTSLGEGSGSDSFDVIDVLDRAEKALEVIIGRNLVPRVPIYLLILLQSLEAGQSSELQNSAYGDCYRYLITGALARAGVKPKEMREYFSYCKLLSWEYCKNKTKQLDEIEFDKFNNEFSIRFHPRELSERINILLKASILLNDSEHYSFCYPYIYYFFLGNYLSDNIDDIDIRKRIDHYCSHLYVRDYANSILFLAHHSSSSYIYERIVEVLKIQFKDKSPVKLDKDTRSIADLVESAPKLVYTGGDAIENRRALREKQDELESSEVEGIHDGTNEEEDELSLLSKLTLLFKTVEILGQILKNQYSTIENPDKLMLINESISGPLRALRDFYDFIEVNNDSIIVEIERILSENSSEISEEKRNNIARKVAFELVTAVSFGVICKTATSIGSEHLKDLVCDVSSRENTNAYRLVELAVKLDSQSTIPYKFINALKRQVDGNEFALHILRGLAIRYLYMFKTGDIEKQRLCASLEISVDTQRAIDLRSIDSKRLK